MKKIFLITLVLSATLLGAQESPLKEGYKPGVFTQDYQKALEYAKEKNLPVLLNFTGSDWCGWCQLMVRQVFSKPAWKEYSRDTLVLVTLDYPQDQSLVPEKFRSRNQRLQSQFEVRGYPTYILLDSNGKSILGRLGAGKDKTAESFIAEVGETIRFSLSRLEPYTRTLTGKRQQRFNSAYSKLKSIRESETPSPAKEAAQIRILEEELTQHMLALMTREEREEYEEAQKSLQTTRKELNQWLATQPQRNDANDKIYADYLNRIKESEKTLRDFWNRLL